MAAGCIWGCEALVEAWRARTERVGIITKKFIVDLKPIFPILFLHDPDIFCVDGILPTESETISDRQT